MKSFHVRSPCSLAGAALAALALVAGASPSIAASQEDLAEVRSEDLRAGERENMRYFLIGAGPDVPAPEEGIKLMLVLPGGDGGEGFNPFVRRIWKNALGDRYLVAQLVAPQWSDEQAERLVWPTKKNSWPKAEFTTEEFVEGVIADVESRFEVDTAHVFTLSWSSGGPAAYASSLSKDTHITGSLVAMSVFKPGQLPSLRGAKGQAYYLLHSPDDFIPISMAQNARKQLAKKGAQVKLEEYVGGHGWHGDVYGMITRGTEWLEAHHAQPRRRKRKQ